MWLLKNALAELLLFPSNTLLLALAGLCLSLRRPRLGGALALAGLAATALLSMSGVGIHLTNRIELRQRALDLDDPALASRADVIVVLGAGRSTESQEYSHRDVVSPAGLLRLRYAAELQRRVHKRILVTGGAPDRPGRPEADLMADALQEDLGTRADWIENKSANTFENARFSFAILGPQGLRRVFLVTNAIHMPRAARSFQAAGFEVVPAPMGYLLDLGGGGSLLSWIPSPKGVEMASSFFHEELGALWYRLSGAY